MCFNHLGRIGHFEGMEPIIVGLLNAIVFFGGYKLPGGDLSIC